MVTTMGTNLECRKVYDLKLSEATNKKKNIDCYKYIYMHLLKGMQQILRLKISILSSISYHVRHGY